MLYSQIIAVCSQIHTKHMNTLCGQNVPRSKHTVSVIKTNQLMLYSEIIAVCSQIHTKHINILCGQNVPRSKHTPSRLQKPVS
jgi:Leu/Phe-tRNA-protein transferase